MYYIIFKEKMGKIVRKKRKDIHNIRLNEVGNRILRATGYVQGNGLATKKNKSRLFLRLLVHEFKRETERDVEVYRNYLLFEMKDLEMKSRDIEEKIRDLAKEIGDLNRKIEVIKIENKH